MSERTILLDYPVDVVKAPDALARGRGPSSVDCTGCGLLLLPDAPYQTTEAEYDRFRREENLVTAAFFEDEIVQSITSEEAPAPSTFPPQASCWDCHRCGRRVVIWWRRAPS